MRGRGEPRSGRGLDPLPTSFVHSAVVEGGRLASRGEPARSGAAEGWRGEGGFFVPSRSATASLGGGPPSPALPASSAGALVHARSGRAGAAGAVVPPPRLFSRETGALLDVCPPNVARPENMYDVTEDVVVARGGWELGGGGMRDPRTTDCTRSIPSPIAADASQWLVRQREETRRQLISFTAMADQLEYMEWNEATVSERVGVYPFLPRASLDNRDLWSGIKVNLRVEGLGGPGGASVGVGGGSSVGERGLGMSSMGERGAGAGSSVGERGPGAGSSVGEGGPGGSSVRGGGPGAGSSVGEGGPGGTSVGVGGTSGGSSVVGEGGPGTTVSTADGGLEDPELRRRRILADHVQLRLIGERDVTQRRRDRATRSVEFMLVQVGLIAPTESVPKVVSPTLIRTM